MFELRSFDIAWQKVDNRNNPSVHYQAEISILRNGVAMYAANVEQDIALARIDGTWLIVGGDQPIVNPELEIPTP